MFINQWKRRSSIQLKNFYRTYLVGYGIKLDLKGAIWQPKYYVFNIHSKTKLNEKLAYMHANPVQAGLVDHAQDWKFGSAHYYMFGKSVMVIPDEQAVYQVMSRTALDGSVEKDFLLKLFKQFSRFYFTEILGFCIMGNHFHLLIKMLPDTEFSDTDIKRG